MGDPKDTRRHLIEVSVLVVSVPLVNLTDGLGALSL
jgi:hypothetical protein